MNPEIWYHRQNGKMPYWCFEFLIKMKSTPAPTDTNHDGMPDDWERVNGLDPENADNRNKFAEN